MVSDPPARPTPAGRVLVIEDDASLAEVLCQLLADEGYVAEHKPDGPAGLARLQAGDIDLVLLDLSLPGMHGLDLCRAARAVAAVGEVYLPIIMLTALSSSADRVAGFAAGADDYVPKPFDADELLGRVRVWLRVHEQMKASQARLRAQYEALAQQAELLELASDGIFVRDLHSRITYWSAGAERLYGWTKAEALGQVSNVLLQTEFPQPLAEIELAVLTRGCWEGELFHTRRDGTRIRLASRWSLQRTADDRPRAILELNTDITLQEAVREAERRALDARLEGVLLAAREVHDLLNNDLTPLVWMVELLPDDLPPEILAKCEPMLRDARAALASAVHHIRQLGYVERVEIKETPVGLSLDLERSSRYTVPASR